MLISASLHGFLFILTLLIPLGLLVDFLRLDWMQHNLVDALPRRRNTAVPLGPII